jgi:hypothetical protein
MMTNRANRPRAVAASAVGFALLALLALPGCNCGRSPGEAPPAAGVTNQEIVGHWSGDWGDMEFRVVGEEIWGSYSHDEGTVVCRWSDDGVLRGWWSEVPSRLPDNDAGDVEFKFSRASGSLALDGKWRYGTIGDWREDWDLGFVTTPAPAALSERFKDSSQFKKHP